jgi:hypothetical protein
MISAGGLLLLGLQNKYSALADRLRALRKELRDLMHDQSVRPERKKKESEARKFQIGRILTRLRLLRDSIFVLYFANLFYILSSILSALIYAGFEVPQMIIFIVFTLGLLSFLASNIFAVIDILISYDVIKSGAGLEPHSITSSIPLTPEEKEVREKDEDEDEDN